MYAIGKFVYSLEPPPNPNKMDALAERGKKIFESEGCAMCHTPPLYTNNMLMPAAGFTPPKDDPATARLRIMRLPVGTDPNLALRTRKGTGYYKAPSRRSVVSNLIDQSGRLRRSRSGLIESDCETTTSERMDGSGQEDSRVPGTSLGWICRDDSVLLWFSEDSLSQRSRR